MPCNRPFSEMAVLRRAILRDASRMDVLKDARRTPRRTLAKLSKQSRRSSTWPAIAASAAGVRRRGWQQHPHQSGEVGHLAAETSEKKLRRRADEFFEGSDLSIEGEEPPG